MTKEKRIKKVTGILAAIFIAAIAFTGCGQGPKLTDEEAKKQVLAVYTDHYIGKLDRTSAENKLKDIANRTENTSIKSRATVEFITLKGKKDSFDTVKSSWDKKDMGRVAVYLKSLYNTKKDKDDMFDIPAIIKDNTKDFLDKNIVEITKKYMEILNGYANPSEARTALFDYEAFLVTVGYYSNVEIKPIVSSTEAKIVEAAKISDKKAAEASAAEEAQRKKAEEEERKKYEPQKIVDSNGKQVWKIYLNKGSMHFTANYKGTGNFIVKLEDSNQELLKVISNEIGDAVIDKTVPTSYTGWYYLEVYGSDGKWTYNWQ